MYVVAHHAVLQYYDFTVHLFQSPSTFNFFKRLLITGFYHGYQAVILFIVLSGFSLMLSVTKNNYSIKGGFKFFLKRRIIRIIPPYLFAMLFSMLLIWLFVGNKTGMHWDSSIPVNYKDVIYHVLLIHDFFSSVRNHINNSFWSISVEFRIYLFFPILVWIWRKYGATLAIFTSLSISIIGSLLLVLINGYNPDIDTNSPGVSPYIVLFTLGMLAADLSFSNSDTAQLVRKHYLKFSSIKIVSGIIIYWLLCAVMLHFFKSNNVYIETALLGSNLLNFTFGIFFSFLLFACAVSAEKDNLLIRILNWRPLIFIGTFSYSLYLIHAPILAFISEYMLTPLNLSKDLSTILLVTIGTPIIIAVSYLFFLICERPFLTLGKKQDQSTIKTQTIENPAP